VVAFVVRLGDAGAHDGNLGLVKTPEDSPSIDSVAGQV